MRRALHARAALGPGVSPRPRRPLRTVTVINMACTCDPHGAGGAASPEPGSWPSPRLVALVPCPWRLSRRSCAAAVVGKQQTVLPGKPFPRLLFGSSVCYAACLLMEKHGAAWLFYLLLIFLFSFFSLLFSSLLHTPPTPLHPFFFSFCYRILFLYPSTIQGIPQAVLPPLPKRPALEKTNGATAVFNTGIFQYQQALANMQLQQHTAFLPPGKCLAGAVSGEGEGGLWRKPGSRQLLVAGGSCCVLEPGTGSPYSSAPCPWAEQGLPLGALPSLCSSHSLGGCFPV